MKNLRTYLLVSLGIGHLITGTILAENKLVKLEYHKKDGIHKGELSLYFSESQAYAEPKRMKGEGDNDKLVFTFPATCGLEISKKFDQVNQSHGEAPFAIKISEKGKLVDVAIEFDSNKIALDIQSFKAIKMEKGIRFTFINKEMLKRISTKRDKPVLTTVQASKPNKVMIDCGHGGKDSGTIGFLGKAEKDITLTVGLEVAQLLNKKGYKAAVTRSADIDLGLSQRTELANFNADLFVSIHANSSANKKAKGIETYCLGYDFFNQGFSTLNKKGKMFIAELDKELCKQSNQLAQCVHKHAVQMAERLNSNIDRKVRPAVSQVLLGADVPSALIEIGFLSNEHEALLLCDTKYQKLVAQGISDGIISYLNMQKSA